MKKLFGGNEYQDFIMEYIMLGEQSCLPVKESTAQAVTQKC